MADATTEEPGETITLSERLPEIIEGRRLRLEIWPLDRAAEVSAAVANSLDELRVWMPWAAAEPSPMETRRKLMAEARRRWEGNGDGNYVMLLNERVVGCCGLHTRQGPGILEIGYWVDSDNTGQGIATEATMMLAEVASSHPDISKVEIHHDRANRASARVAVKAGFVFGGERRDEASTPAEEGVDWVWRHMTLPGFEIRPERSADYEQIKDVVATAFDSPVEAKLVDDIRSSPEYVPEFALVAETDSGSDRTVIGHVMISGCELRDTGSVTAIKMLSPLAVHPDWQRRGVGGALVKSVVDRADEAGEPLVIVEGNPAYYNRFGFGPAKDHGITINVPDWAPPEAGQVIRLGHYDPDLIGTVVYPKAFDGIE